LFRPSLHGKLRRNDFSPGGTIPSRSGGQRQRSDSPENFSWTAASLLRTSQAVAKFYPVNRSRPLGRRRAWAKASLKYFFVRYSARKMEGDPGARGRSHEKVSISNVETRVSHACNEADLPCAGSESATR
jgi:hypothetical protein